MSQITQPTAL